MRKSNVITFLFFCFLIAVVGVYTVAGKSQSDPEVLPDQYEVASGESAKEDTDVDLSKDNTVSDVSKDEQETPSKEEETPATKPEETTTDQKEEPKKDEPKEEPKKEPEKEQPKEESKKEEPKKEEPKKDQTDTPVKVSMQDALFIGDSRTVGLMEYAGIKEADFFCSTGMSVFSLQKNAVSVPGVGKVKLTKLLETKKYKKIYVMLGINELGYPFKSIVSKYGELISLIQKKQPDATIFIQANLHVSKKRSDSDKTINNKKIDQLNAELAKLADQKTKFYLDVNPQFDDKNGALASDKSQDNAHLYAKYYAEWGQWIMKETASIMKEGDS